MSSDRAPAADLALQRRSVVDSANPLDLKNPDAHVSDAIFDIYRRLLAEGPVHWNDEVDDRGFWAVLGYDAIEEVQKHPEIFSADVRNGGYRIFDARNVAEVPGRMLLMLDPPEQTELRRALVPFFTADQVAAREPSIRERAERLVAQIAAKGEAEFVSAISAPFTMGLATDLLGLPEEFGATLAGWVAVLLADDDREVQPSIEVRKAVIAAFDEFAMELYTGAHRSQSGIVRALRDTEVGGGTLNFHDFSVNLIALCAAFSETTRQAISYAVIALDKFPDQRQLLLDHPGLTPLAAREVIRWTTPIQHVRRTAMCDTLLGGRQIRRGDKVVVWYSAANRDPCKWQNPDALDVTRFEQRGTCPSLAFGAGAHFCIGWRFAELEVGVMIETLLRTIPDIRPAKMQRFRSNFVRGISSLDVVFTPLR